MKSPYLDNQFQYYNMIFYLFILSFLTNSQIWLILLVDDNQCGHIAKLEKKQKKKKKKKNKKKTLIMGVITIK